SGPRMTAAGSPGVRKRSKKTAVATSSMTGMAARTRRIRYSINDQESAERDIPEERVGFGLIALQFLTGRLQLSVFADLHTRNFSPLQLLQLSDEIHHFSGIRFGEHGGHELVAFRVLPEARPSRRKIGLKDRVIERLVTGDEDVVLLRIRPPFDERRPVHHLEVDFEPVGFELLLRG